MATFRTEVTTFPELRRTLRAVQDCIDKLDASQVEGMRDLVAPSGVAAAKVGGRIAVTDKHGEWVELPRGASTDILAGDDDATKRIGWSSRLTTVETDKVEGIASSVDNTVMRWDGTGGKTAQGSGILLNDDDSLGACKVQPTDPSLTETVELGAMWLKNG